MPELLVELLSEEIPAGMQTRAAADLKRLVSDALEERSLTFDRAEAYVSPRRLVLVVRGLPERQPDVRRERKGPRTDAPDKAIDGFFAAVGRTRDQVEERETPKGTFLFVDEMLSGGPTKTVAAEALRDVIQSFPWPKSMRWPDADLRWVRPLRRLLAVFDKEPLPLDLPIKDGGTAPMWAENTTLGHRFMAREEFAVKGFDDYQVNLRRAYVILDPAERVERIRSESEARAAEQGLRLRADEALIAEVAGLVEWPVPLLGRIDSAFMELPSEVLYASMATHQRYLALETADGALAPRFIAVANVATKDKGAAIIAGNERVLRARLADAKFFWDQDRRSALASRAPALAEIAFHAKLGTLDQKADRVQALAAEIALLVPGADKDKVRSAARLAKADLVTGMVGEFPGLQGIMGRYYALADGEDTEVADAIRDQYAPKGPDDACPTAPVSVALGLAERIDTLVGFWAIGEKPTGSKDPFALRRATLGVIRLLVENGLRIPLTPIFAAAAGQLPRDVRSGWSDEVGRDLLSFFADRLKVHLRDRGMRHDLISAVFALTGEDDLVRLLARVDALADFLGSTDGGDLLVAYRRAANIVRIEEKKDAAEYRGTADGSLFRQREENALSSALDEAQKTLAQDLEREQFADAMASLAKLRPPVDRFFDAVKVNDEDPDLRANRLRFLSQITSTLEQVADFSKIEG